MKELEGLFVGGGIAFFQAEVSFQCFVSFLNFNFGPCLSGVKN